MFASNNEAALNMFTCRYVNRYLLAKGSFIIVHSEETMIAFLGLLKDKYGGVEEYLKQYTHLSEDDITTIRNNMLVSSNSQL